MNGGIQILPLIQVIIATAAVGLQCCSTVFIIVGVPLVILQLREQTRATRTQADSIRLSAYLQMMDLATDANRLVLESDDLEGFYDKRSLPSGFPTKWDKMSHKQRQRYLYLGRLLSQFERVHILKTRQWMDDQDFEAYNHHLREVISLPLFALWWNELRPYYRKDFAAHVESLRPRNG